MSATRVEFSEIFEKEFERLSRKYQKTPDVVEEVIEALSAGELIGDKIPNVGYDVYKVRLPNPSANRGKSGGFRLIYYVRIAEHIVLISLYAKNEQSDVSIAELKRQIAEYNESLEN